MENVNDQMENLEVSGSKEKTGKKSKSKDKNSTLAEAELEVCL